MRFHNVEVTAELLDAIRVYDAQRPGRGGRFMAELEITLRRIRESPLSFPKVAFVLRPTLRRAKVLRFPYSVIYYVLHGEPVVVAIDHGRRTPAYWRDRLHRA